MTEIVWRSAERTPERALLYGGQGAGKTLAALMCVSKALSKTRSETLFFIDTDNSYGKFEKRFAGKLGVKEEWEPGGKFSNKPAGMVKVEDWVTSEADGGNVVLYHPNDWVSFDWCMKDAWSRAGRGDWVAVDSVTHPWQWVVEWYIRKVHGEGLPEFLIAYRVQQIADDKKDAAGAGAMLVEYNYVNKVWSETFLTPYVNARCHVVITAEAKEVRTDDRGDKKDIKQLYGKVMMKPDGQRRIGANSHTVLYLEQAVMGRDGWMVSTVKDRERERLWREDVNYEERGRGLETLWMKDVAGWTPTRIETGE